MTPSLYRRLLGPAFDHLPPQVLALHDLTAASVWAGRADVERGRSWPSRAAALLFSLPPDGPDQPLSVTFEPVDGKEVWTRTYSGKVFRSVQSQRGGRLCEQIGPVRLLFTLDATPDGVAMRLEGMRVLGVPLPRWLHPRVRSFDCERDGRYRFEVEAHLPLFGLLVRYSGWLERAPQLTA